VFYWLCLLEVSEGLFCVCGFHNAIFIVNVNIIALIIIVMKTEVFCDAKILKDEGNNIL